MREFCVRLRHRRRVFHKFLAEHGGEHRLYRADALAVALSAPGAIDSALHALCCADWIEPRLRCVSHGDAVSCVCLPRSVQWRDFS